MLKFGKADMLIASTSIKTHAVHLNEITAEILTPCFASAFAQSKCFWPVCLQSLRCRVGWLTSHGLIEIIKGQIDTPPWVGLRLMCCNVN